MAKLVKSVPSKVSHGLCSSDWAQPDTINDLAVDSKKVEEIKSWLMKFKNKGGVLLLSGPTGCGKSATVKCLAKYLGFLLREWVTPLDRDFSNAQDADYFPTVNQVEKFEDFLQSCSRYSSLFNNISSSSSLLLVEDYPNVFLRSPETFHEVLMRYCASARSPVVFICSEVADQDLKLATDLFPVHMRLKLGISQISFNSVTKSRMVIALKRMCTLLHRLNPSFKPPGQDTISDICDNANGDVRYAMLLLQIKPQEDSAALFNMAMKPNLGKRRYNAKVHTKEDIAVASCEKDDRVGLLHGVGRVLYPKWRSSNEKIQTAPKRKRAAEEKLLNATVPRAELIHNPVAVVNSFLSTASTFLLFVQENYLNTFSTIDSVAAAASCLSLSDTLMTAESYQTSHEISFDLGIRGVMIHNQVPNRAWNPVKGPRHLGMARTRKDVLSMAEALFRKYPINLTTLMVDYVPIMSHINNVNLSHDQKQFVSHCASMESLTKFCESFVGSRHCSKEHVETCKASFLLDGKHRELSAQDCVELHISEEESDEEIDEGSQNLSMLEAAIMEEERQEEDYRNLLNDSDADILLSQL